jgi:hypothetical protein
VVEIGSRTQQQFPHTARTNSVTTAIPHIRNLWRNKASGDFIAWLGVANDGHPFFVAAQFPYSKKADEDAGATSRAVRIIRKPHRAHT